MDDMDSESSRRPGPGTGAAAAAARVARTNGPAPRRAATVTASVRLPGPDCSPRLSLRFTGGTQAGTVTGRPWLHRDCGRRLPPAGRRLVTVSHWPWPAGGCHSVKCRGGRLNMHWPLRASQPSSSNQTCTGPFAAAVGASQPSSSIITIYREGKSQAAA